MKKVVNYLEFETETWQMYNPFIMMIFILIIFISQVLLVYND